MLNHQKHLFQLPENIHYINCAYMSPLLKSVEEAGMAGMVKKRNPIVVRTDDFFELGQQVREKFGQLIHAPGLQTAIIPSVSYGMGTAVKNIVYRPGSHALVVADEFPSSFYAIAGWCNTHGAPCKTIAPPKDTVAKGARWNHTLLEAINADTAMVALSTVHWMDGTKFDLEQIGQRCQEVGAKLLVDGTQSVGALPIDVEKYHIDALICAGYKWLMGPYAIGMAYFRESFNTGIPLEESWMNKPNASQFGQLTSYTTEYTDGAGRFNVGEYSNFILLPMIEAALDQLLLWQPSQVQAYCEQLTQPLINYFNTNEFALEEKAYRSNHLLGITLPDVLDEQELLSELQKRNLYVSVRGKSMRISPHVYNTPEDIEALIAALDETIITK